MTDRRTLRSGTPAEAGLIPRHAERIVSAAASGLRPGTGTDGHPLYPGAVVLAARGGVIAVWAAAGHNLRYADRDGAELARGEWISTSTDTIYDLASLSKLFTSIVAVQLIEQGDLSLGTMVASHLPRFAGGRDGITVGQLLTHTSGLRPDPSPPLWTYPARRQRLDAVCAATPQAPPGTAYLYSDLNMIVLQLLVEEVTGRPLDALVREAITGPLRMTDTMYNPPTALRHRVAATEYQQLPSRGLVWGQVHDENARALGGAAGHAGVFSTAHDLAILCQALLNGGEHGGSRILSPASVATMMADHDRAFRGAGQGLGFELCRPGYMGALTAPGTAGHTGFTGTSLVIDPADGSFVILLTNRVHPSRDRGSINPVRQAVASAVARARAVRPAAPLPPSRGC
jgi:CubicO group peptidase (beta-lactamase class C family)